MKHGRGNYPRCTDGFNGRACEVCREGHREQANESRRRRTARLKADPTLAEYGKPATYQSWGCRCRPCTDAATEYRGGYPDYHTKRVPTPGGGTVIKPKPAAEVAPPRRRRYTVDPIGRDWIDA